MARAGAGSADVAAAEHPTAHGRIGALDGLRGLAVAAVLAFHVAPAAAPGGFLGVDAFFVLSGFLLTSLLIAEHRRTDRIDRRAYAMRRVRRLGPGLLALLAALVVVVPWLAPGDAHRLRGDIGWSLIGLTNWHLIAGGSSYFTHLGRPPFVQHLWSVAVEIQFYVLCPWLVGGLVRRRRGVALVIVGAGIATSAAAMAALAQRSDPSRAYYGTDARLGALLVGMFLALLLTRHEPRGISVARRGTGSIVGVGALASLLAAVLLIPERSPLMYPFGFTGAEIAVATLIASALRPGALGTMLGSPPLRWLGQRSYGIYLWHWPIVILLRPNVDVHWSPWVTGLVVLTASGLAGELSYRFIERPHLSRRTQPRRRPVWRTAQQVALAATAIALAVVLIRLPTHDDIATSLQSGQRVLAAGPFTTTTQPQTADDATTSSAPARAVAATNPGGSGSRAVAPAAYSPHLAAPPPGSIPVTAVGDSVMLGGASALQARLGSSGHIDAKVGRQFGEGIDVIRGLREQGRLGRVVIVHLGNNGTVKASQIDALMHELDSVPNVLLVTVRVDASWQDSVNRTLHDAADRYSKITLVDWFSYSAGHTDWFWSDRTHLRPSGAAAYADLLAGSIPAPPPPPPTTSTSTSTTTSTTSTTVPPTTTTTEPPTTTSTTTSSTTLPTP